MLRWVRSLFGGEAEEPVSNERQIAIRLLESPLANSAPPAPVRERKTPLSSAPGEIMLTGRTNLSVTGVTFYQEAIGTVAAAWHASNKDPRRSLPRIVVSLILDPFNPHDPNAVRVQTGNFLLGHLRREDAAAYQPLLRQLATREQIATGKAVIRVLRGSENLCVDIEEFVAPGYKL